MAPLFAAALLAACGTSTPCDALNAFLEEECDVAPTAIVDAEDCADDSVMACLARCGQEAQCDVHTVPDNPIDQDYLDQIAAHTVCRSEC